MKRMIWVYILYLCAGFLSMHLWGVGGLIGFIGGLLLAHLSHKVEATEKKLKELKDLEPPTPDEREGDCLILTHLPEKDTNTFLGQIRKIKK